MISIDKIYPRIRNVFERRVRMKLKKSLEQAVCILIMLTLEKEHRPVKSSIISERLEVSDSYSKKILRQLVVANLIKSEAGKEGGFKLARSIEKISMLDVYYAIEGKESILQPAHLAHKVFSYENIIVHAEKEVLQVVSEAEQLFLTKLEGYYLSELLPRHDYEQGTVVWKNIREVIKDDKK